MFDRFIADLECGSDPLVCLTTQERTNDLGFANTRLTASAAIRRSDGSRKAAKTWLRILSYVGFAAANIIDSLQLKNGSQGGARRRTTPPTTTRRLEPSLPPSFSSFFPFPRLYIRCPVQPVADVELATVAVRWAGNGNHRYDFVHRPTPSGPWVSRGPVGV